MKQDYLDARRPNMKRRSHEECTRHLDKHWKPLHNKSIASIDRATVAARLRTIAKESGPVAADRARSSLSAMFAWTIGEGLCDANPVDGTNKASDEKPRDRVLTDAELASIWKAAPDNSYGRIVRLLMLTAQRRDEIGSLSWSEIDLEAKQISLPSERTKNSKPHDVPLSDAAVAVLDSTPEREGRALLFGSRLNGYSGWSTSKKELDESAKLAEPWTLHDLRRTAATRMADLGVLPHVIEAILNHISGHKAGVAGIYNRSTYAAEKRAALDMWANHILVAVAKAEGANVAKLARKRLAVCKTLVLHAIVHYEHFMTNEKPTTLEALLGITFEMKAKDAARKLMEERIFLQGVKDAIAHKPYKPPTSSQALQYSFGYFSGVLREFHLVPKWDVVFDAVFEGSQVLLRSR